MQSRSILWAVLALTAPAAHAVEVPGHYPTAGNAVLSSSDTTVTPAELATFLGAPDDLYTGLGGQWVTYDFGNVRILDGAGLDFNVYEVDSGSPEWVNVDILVSADNVNFFNVEGSFGPAVDLVGDDLHGSAAFRRGFDLGGAVTALGVSQFRYLRVKGTLGTGPINSTVGFDLDAVGLVNFTQVTAPPAIPEPGTWAMLIAGFGLTGAAARRRRSGVVA